MPLRAERCYIPLAGVRSDLDAFIKEFTAIDTVRYEQFAEIWQRRNISLIFCGRQTERELKEFIEDLFLEVLEYLSPSQSFQVQVAGLYLLYGLYLTQPLETKTKIRVTHEKMLIIQQCQTEMKKQGHLDCEYILYKLRMLNALHFVARPGTYDILQPFSMVEEDSSGNTESTLPEKSVVSEILQPDNIAQLATIHEQYVQMKCKLAESDKPDKSLSVIQPDIVQYLTRAVASHEEWRKTGKRIPKKDGGITSESEAESDVEHPKSSVSQGRKRTSIKERAFSQTADMSRRRRHRQVAVQSGSDQSPEKKYSPKKAKKGSKASRVESVEEQEVLKEPTLNLREQMKTVLLNMPKFDEEGKEVSKRGRKSGKVSEKTIKGKSSPKGKSFPKVQLSPKAGRSKRKLSESDQSEHVTPSKRGRGRPRKIT